MKLALATCAEHPNLIEDDQPLRKSLTERGANVTAAVWDDTAVDWSAFDLVVIRSTWDYFHRVEQFTAWVDQVTAVTRLENPANLVKWNVHKGYLEELQVRGVPVVPTEMLPRGSAHELGRVMRRRGWGEAVVKPAVAAGAEGTIRLRLAEAGEHQAHLEALLAKGDVLVQPFVESVTQGGERSLIFFDGRYSHALKKQAAPGDFRVQPQFGGIITPDQPPQRVKDLARSILEAAEVDPLYARVDLVRIGEKWKLTELELIEPLLFFHTDAKSVHRFVDAILRRV